MKVYLAPPETHSNGGIRRVVEAQYRYLPEFGIELTSDPFEAEVEAVHVIGKPQNPKAAFVLHNHGMMWSEYFDSLADQEINHQIVESMRYANAITSPSQWVTKAIHRGVYFPIETIYHGVDSNIWFPSKEVNKYVVWNKARVDAVSNPEDMNRLAELLPEVEFLSTFGKVTDNVRVVGNISNGNMRGMIDSAGLYLCTARETFGIGTLEALACGVPVVGWNYGGQSEIIRDGETGYLAPYGDYAGLADCVRRALRDRKRLSRNAVDDVQARWQWRDKVAQYATLYKQAAAWYTAPRPKVSVIVPSHNLAKYLPYTLKSIQDQTMDNFECIIVDDCSTDETSEIAKAIVKQDIRFRYQKTHHNLKLSKVRNWGAELAMGKYIQYVDADDMLPSNTLELLSQALDQERNVHIVYGALELVNEQGTHRRPNRFPQDFNWYQQMAHQNQVPTGAMMRREVIEQSGGWRERQWRAEDAEFWARVTSLGYQAKKVTSETTLFYRVRNDSKGSTEFRTYEDRDGNWLANIAWRSANSAQEGMQYLQQYGETVPQLDLVPFGAQAKPVSGFWNVSHRQEPLVTIIVTGHKNLEDTLDSLHGQYMSQWEIVVVGEAISGFSDVLFVKDMQTALANIHATYYRTVTAGQMFPNDWLNRELDIKYVKASEPTEQVLLQYTGTNQARMSFRVNGNTYHGEAGVVLWAPQSDATKLIDRGAWKLTMLTSPIPEPQVADKRR